MFEIDANGIVNVSAKDKMTGFEQAMQITPSSGLAPDEIERLIMEAETSVEQDKSTKELIMQRNKLESLIKNTRRAMHELGKTLPLEQQQEINGVLNKAEEAVDADSMEFIQPALEQAEEAANMLTASLMTVGV
jgi:molecular chaperone DnaK